MTAADSHPPAPWRLRGEASIVVVPVRAEAARRSAIPAGVTLLTVGGWTVGGVMLARYDQRATLPYHELIVFSGLARAAGRPAFVVSHIYVDSLPSLRGGREIWGLPKELADFEWSARTVTVAQNGQALLRASLRRRAGHIALPLYAPVFGDRAGVSLRAAGRGRINGTPALAGLEVPSTSPFAHLGLRGRHLAVAGDELDLHFPSPAEIPGV